MLLGPICNADSAQLGDKAESSHDMYLPTVSGIKCRVNEKVFAENA